MARLMMIIFLALAASVITLSLRPDHWEKLDKKAATDAKLFTDLIARPDRIGWRLTEDLTLNRVILWGPDARLRYPAPDGFTPLLYEFSEDEKRLIAAKQSTTSAPTWEKYNTSGSELLNCRAAPAICIIYDRSALEEMFDLRDGTLLSADRNSIWRVILIALAVFSGGAVIWLKRGSRQDLDEFTLVPERHCAMRGGFEILLSPRDMKLLSLLDARNGAVATKDELYDAGWGRDFMPNSRALDQHMINLRRKLDPHKSLPVLIETVHGIGYRLVK